jgi:hypothetical protein
MRNVFNVKVDEVIVPRHDRGHGRRDFGHRDVRRCAGLEHGLEQTPVASQNFRPWQFDVPTLEEMSEEDWPFQVKDWGIFWTRHMVWQQYVRMSEAKRSKKRQKEQEGWRKHEEWWGLGDVNAVKEVC